MKPTRARMFADALRTIMDQKPKDYTYPMNAAPIHSEEGCGPLDRVLKSDFQSTKPLNRSPIMARAPKNNKPQSAAAAAVGAALVNKEVAEQTAADNSPDAIPEGYTHTHNSTAGAPVKEDKAAAKAEERAAKLAAKNNKADEKKAEQAAKAQARADKKAEREAKLVELAAGKNYVGSMLALAERVKSGAYVKSSTGQLRSNDDLAQLLDTVPPSNVIKLGKGLELPGDYSQLNVGQQSMNYRNRMRGALKKGTLTIDAIRAKIVELDLDAASEIAAKTKAAADAKAAREAAAEAKKAAKPVDTAPAAE